MDKYYRHWLTNERPDLSSEERTLTLKQKETSVHEPQTGLDTKTDRLTDRQSQCDFAIYSNATRVESGSNTSTVTLRVVVSDENGSLKSGTVKYGHESYWTRTRKWLRWPGPVAITNARPILPSERAPQMNKPATVTQK
jgi:hypothetical protein